MNPEVTASYIVSQDGAYTKAKNGLTGQIDFSGADAATVIQATINELGASGGTIHFKCGEYSILVTLALNFNVNLIGEGEYNETRFSAGINNLNPLLSITGAGGSSNIEKIRFEVQVGFSGVALIKIETNQVHLNDLIVDGGNGADYGIIFSAGATYNIADHVRTYDCAVSNILFENNSGYNKYLNGYIADVNNKGGKGIISNDSSFNIIFGTHIALFANAAQYSVSLANSGIQFLSCYWEGIDVDGGCIFASSCSHIYVRDSIVGDDDHTNMIRLVGVTNFQMSGCRCWATAAVGNVVRVSNNCNKVIIKNNILESGGALYSDFDLSTTNLVVKDNDGWVTENKVLSPAFAIDGVAVVTVTIPHGLNVTPAVEDCQLTVTEDTNVDDWEHGYVKVESVGAANVVAKVNVTNASATGGATAKLALSVTAWDRRV